MKRAWLLLVILLVSISGIHEVQAQEVAWTRYRVDPQWVITVDKTGIYASVYKDGDYFIRKYSKDGNELWTRPLGIVGVLRIDGISIFQKEMYVAGTIQKTIGQEPFSEAFVRKYDIDGNHIWTKFFGDYVRWDGFRNATASNARAVSADSSGLYIIGTRTRYNQSGMEQSGFIRKYDFNGNEIWTRELESGSTSISVNSFGVYVVGGTQDALPGQVHAGGVDPFIQRFDYNGNEIWTRQFGTSKDDWVNGIAVHKTGVYAAGMTEGALAGEMNLGLRDAFVSRFDLNGKEIWTRQFGATFQVGNKTVRYDKEDSAYGITVDSTGVYVAGHTFAELPGQKGGGPQDPFVRKYDFDGNEVWTWQFGSGDNDVANQIAVDETGVYIVGSPVHYGPCCPSFGYSSFMIKLVDKSRVPAPIWRCVLEGFEPYGCDSSSPSWVWIVVSVAIPGAFLMVYYIVQGRKRSESVTTKPSLHFEKPN
ncbi:MAG: hypothetical protein HYU02_06800 [Thaumarchaeota archaeon]|nr:hypothetical protein [Nitrososphaerota archaeon]